MPPRIWIIPLLAVAALCGFGLIATREPGTPLGWSVGYGIVLILCLIASAVVWFRSANP